MKTHGLKAAMLTAAYCIATLPAAQVASATDYKTFSGTACMPYGANTSWAELTFRPGGVTTEGTSNEYILCGVSTDTENGWTNAASANMGLSFKTSSTTGSPITCTATSGSAFIFGALTYAGSLNLAQNETGTLTLSNIVSEAGYSWVPLTVSCRLPPKTTLARIYVNEMPSTYSPPA